MAVCVTEYLSLHCVFFFSSRRRHTRCLSDWSSDVCSSDLDHRVAVGVRPTLARAADQALVGAEYRGGVGEPREAARLGLDLEGRKKERRRVLLFHERAKALQDPARALDAVVALALQSAALQQLEKDEFV